MNREVIQRMQGQFDAITHMVPGEGVEFWFARDLQEPLGYARWENFLTAIQRAIESCETTGYQAADHFRDVTKMITHGTTPASARCWASVVSSPKLCLLKKIARNWNAE